MIGVLGCSRFAALLSSMAIASSSVFILSWGTRKDLEWIRFIVRLKNTGMELKDIQKYSHLREAGDSTIEERMSLLDDQEKLLLKKKAELESHIQFLQKKKVIYRNLLKK